MMRLSNIVVTICLTALILLPFAARAAVDWEVAKAVQLDATPIAVAHSQDGGLTFILTDQAQVVIYATGDKLVGTIPVDAAVAGIAVSARGDELYLINSQRKTLQTLAVNLIVPINVADAPFLGPADAKVAVAVFSDFQ